MCTPVEVAAVGSLILGTHGAEQAYHAKGTQKRTASRMKKEREEQLRKEAIEKNTAKRSTYTNTRDRIKRGEQRGRMSTILGQGGSGL